MRRKSVVVILVILMCLGLVRIYSSPDENHKYEADLPGTINAGHWFSWLLFIGNQGRLLSGFDFVDAALSKLKKADIRQVFWKDILDKYKAGGGKYEWALRSMLFREPEDIELVALERQGIYTAMSFRLNNSLQGLDIPGKGPMLYSIVFRYYEPGDESLLKKVLRKTANAVPFCSPLGTTGRWLVVDYSYTYNQSDYATWYLQAGDTWGSRKEKDTEDFLKSLKDKDGFQEFVRGWTPIWLSPTSGQVPG